eukprot:3452413-Pyramimonas_sp.AAC.1
MQTVLTYVAHLGAGKPAKVFGYIPDYEWINLAELVNEFPWNNGRTRQDGHNPKQDEAQVIAANFYGRTVDQMAAIMMAIVRVRERDGEEKQRLQFKVLVRDS